MTFAKLDLGPCKEILENNKRMTGNEWAEEYAYLSSESSVIAGKWVSLPFQPEIINAATSEEDVECVVWKKASRVGFTKCLLIVSGYHIEHKPSGQLIVQPTVEDAEGFSKEDLATFIRDVPVLDILISDVKVKDGSNSILHKQYPGGVLSIIGANSPRGFRRITRPVILLDEVSAYPDSAGSEGDPIQLAIRRATGFAGKKIFIGSSPKIKDNCSITRYFEETDQRYYFVECPHCGHAQSLKWSNFKIPDDNPDLAYFECEKTKCKIEHKDKFAMIEKGKWNPTAIPKNPKWRGYHIWTAYSYNLDCTWSDIARSYLQAKRHGREALQTFVNTWLGESFDDAAFLSDSAVDIQKRSEAYPLGTAPNEVVFVTAGIDVQDNRIAVEKLGWGMDEQCWILDYHEIFGNPGESKIWAMLDEYLAAPISHEKFKELTVSAAAIDTGGHHTHAVYQYARERKHKNIIPIRGASVRNKPVIGKGSPVDVNYRGNIMKKGVHLYSLGVDTIKSILYSRIKISEVSALYIHFSAALTLDFFMGIQSEKKITTWKRGKLVSDWVKLSATVRNEPLDCWVYAFAAKEFFIKRFPRGMAAQIILKELNQKNLKNDEEHRDVKTEQKVPSRRRGGFRRN